MEFVITVVIAILCLYVANYFLQRTSKISLQNKVVVITGASSGLGRACCKEFHKLRCKLVLCSRNIEQLRALKKELVAHNTLSPEPIIVPLDLCEMKSVEAASERIDHLFPNGVHILINNAGISYRGEIIHTSIEVFKKVMETNFFGQVHFTKLMLPILWRVKDKTHVVCINSVQGNISIPHRSCYSTSKFACTAFYDCLRSEVSQFGTNVFSVYPGYIKTNLSLNAVTAEGKSYGSLDATTANGMDPQYVGRKIIDGIQHTKHELWISDSKSHLAMWLRVLFPSLYFWYMERRAQSFKIKS